ncbi:hypothetical protein [Ktedonobacter robiniae]|uniref:Uncharacterized protein n=1 Tax=Ktedonobacter robiniae TaxID=2778365 RepID=A0ABQ3V4Z9_9CHLR|nr:hypothetical protein [Ktedonobacter robiniae]GHO60083.1 hypothetical protein KSB_85580 [Ktedonobacter robiniae]
MRRIALPNVNRIMSRDWLNIRSEPMKSMGVDVVALEQNLRAKVRGEVRFDAGSLALYTTDASNYSSVAQSRA